MTNHSSNTVDTRNSARPGRREQLFEVSAFLFLIVPSLILSLFAIKQGKPSFICGGRAWLRLSRCTSCRTFSASC